MADIVAVDRTKYPETHPKSGRACRIEERKGRKVYVYPNKHGEDGAIIDVETGRIAGQPKLSLERTFTHETAIAAIDAKKTRAIEAAERGLMRGTGQETIHGGWEIITAAQARLAQADEQGNASTRAAEFVGKATGILGDDRVKVTDPGGGSVAGTPAQVLELLEGMRAHRARLMVEVRDGHESER